ncbi:MAG: hypothetical protein FD153_1348 [Rhodospirillaceae bacterium]|nr:MAG: hypothetical protein FD153_1348 [Rhodospirillaceae bacterium]
MIPTKNPAGAGLGEGKQMEARREDLLMFRIGIAVETQAKLAGCWSVIDDTLSSIVGAEGVLAAGLADSYLALKNVSLREGNLVLIDPTQEVFVFDQHADRCVAIVQPPLVTFLERERDYGKDIFDDVLDEHIFFHHARRR